MHKCQTGSPGKDDDSIQDATESAMAFTEYYASTYFAAAKIFWRERPKEPPKGFLGSFLVFLVIFRIISSMTVAASMRLVKMKRNKKKHRVRKRSAIARARICLRRAENKSKRFYRRLAINDAESWKSFVADLHKFLQPTYFNADDGYDIYHDAQEYHSTSASEGVSSVHSSQPH